MPDSKERNEPSMPDLIIRYRRTNDLMERQKILSYVKKRIPGNEAEIEEIIKESDGDIAVIRKDADRYVAIALSDSLGNIKNPAFGKMFHKYLKQGDHNARFVSVRAIGSLKYQAAVPDLVKIISAYNPETKKIFPQDHMIQVAAINSLGEIGDDEALQGLFPLLRKEDNECYVANTIAKFGRKAFPRLLEICRTSKDKIEKEAACNSIGMMTDKGILPDLWKFVKEDPSISSKYLTLLLKNSNETTDPSYTEIVDFVRSNASKSPYLKGSLLEVAKDKKDIEYLIPLKNPLF